MNFNDLAQKRYSIRKFKDMPVDKEKILQVIEGGRNAPSAHNFQPWHFIVITDEEMRKKMWEVYTKNWFKSAPVIVVACGNHDQSWKRDDGKDHCDIDIAIAVDHMTLAATDIGLGTCWVCAFDAKKCHEILNLPPNIEPIALMPMGYPLEDKIVEKKRKTLDEIVSWEEYKEI